MLNILNWSRPDLNLWAWCQSIIWNLMTQTSYIEPVWSLLTRLSTFNPRLYIFHTFCIHIVAPQYRLWIVIFFFLSLNRWPWNNSWVIGVPCPTSSEIGARSQLWQQNQDVLFPWGTFVTGSQQGWIVYISKWVCVCAGGLFGVWDHAVTQSCDKEQIKMNENLSYFWLTSFCLIYTHWCAFSIYVGLAFVELKMIRG